MKGKSFKDYWAELVGRNPQLTESEKMTMTPAAFKKELSKAYSSGFEQGKVVGCSFVDKIGNALGFGHE